jgi:hypothetical protein
MASSFLSRVTCGAALSLLTLLSAPPARADTLPDIQMLVQGLAAFGTRVAPAECKQKGLQGYYEPAKDRIVICTDSLTNLDPASVWDVLAHEATHKMQHCVGGFLMPPTHVGQMMRQLRATYPETLLDLHAYASAESRFELEARWMQLQPPGVVVQILDAACRRS